jgi:serine/threonine protein phosphatase PrpC
MDLKFGYVCDRGLNPKRPVNQDSFLAIQDEGLFAVFDGVGGQKAGEVASQTAAETVEEALSNHREDSTPELVRRAIQFANRDIFELAESDRSYKTMATTVALVLLRGESAVIAHVGDSRVYRLAEGRLTRETIDHTDFHDHVKAGIITAEEADEQGESHVINRALGIESDVEVDLKTLPLAKGVRFLLCTDGIYRYLSDDQIREVLAGNQDPQAAAEELKRFVHQRGADDNLTAIVVDALPGGNNTDSGRIRRNLESGGSGIRKRSGGGGTSAHNESRRSTGRRDPITKRIHVEVGGNATNSPGADYAGRAERTAGRESVARLKRFSGTDYIIFILVSLVLIAGGFYAGLRAPEYLKIRRPGSTAAGVDALQAARDAFDRGDYQAAGLAFSALLQRDPQNATVHYWLGRSQLEQGQYAQAARSFEQALAIAPGLHDAYVQAAAAYEAAGNRAKAAEAIARYEEQRRKETR